MLRASAKPMAAGGQQQHRRQEQRHPRAGGGDGKAEQRGETGKAVIAAEAGLVAKEQQHAGIGQRLVMIEKYTPLIFERKAK